MVRRSKEDALATRNSLLDAAERVFLAQGVAGTSLNDIAVEAGTTRGAIYWHFRDKADLFNAMMDRVVMPLQCALESVQQPAGGDDPLPRLKKALRAALHALVDGLIQNWLLEPQGFDLETVGTRAIDAYMQGIGLQ